ncbi:hypothetical protein GCM10022254_09920 [Actinomadura meridiana]|uniref:Uncharacterized protein n=1 Tax=Actinomadura meridiana TaxID=559626 RepID=A0ABP8BTT9_9ACTN
MITAPCLCTREDVKRAVDIKLTARADDAVDRAIEAATDVVTGQLHRSFFPWTGTRYFDWPRQSRAWILRLDQHEVVSVSSLVTGGVTIPPANYFLEPNGSGPPYTRIEMDISSTSAFSTGDTTQRAIAVTGVYCGVPADTAPAGALDGSISDAATSVTVTDGSLLGVGDVLLVGTERILVAGTAMADTGVTASALTASNNDVALTVSSSTGAPQPGEVILIGAERMLVVDAVGTALVVKRAWDGSALAAHDAATAVYAARSLTVQRGLLGTTAAAHSDAAAVARHVVPGLVRQYAVAEAISQGLQEGAGWARQAGSGDNEREVLQRGLGVLRDQAYTAFGRKARTRAV